MSACTRYIILVKGPRELSRADVYKLIALADAIKAGKAELAELEQYPTTIAAAVKKLIADEREACAMVAEAAAEGAGVLGRAGKLEAISPETREICLEIARQIRARRD